MGNRKWTVKSILKTVWISVGAVFILWMCYSYQSRGVDQQLLQSSSHVTVDITDDFYSFTPSEESKNVLFFFPGAMVDTKAYIPLCRKIAESNLSVYLIRMPWRLASKGYNKPKELNLFSDTTKTYILSGHSLGAKMAAQFVYENGHLVDKLILIGTSHPRDISLEGSEVPILKIYGSKDGVADEQSIESNRRNLPETAKFVRIEGANHSQFGYYGFQLGDNRADISRERQQAETLRNMLEFIGE